MRHWLSLGLTKCSNVSLLRYFQTLFFCLLVSQLHCEYAVCDIETIGFQLFYRVTFNQRGKWLCQTWHGTLKSAGGWRFNCRCHLESPGAAGWRRATEGVRLGAACHRSQTTVTGERCHCAALSCFGETADRNSLNRCHTWGLLVVEVSGDTGGGFSVSAHTCCTCGAVV